MEQLLNKIRSRSNSGKSTLEEQLTLQIEEIQLIHGNTYKSKFIIKAPVCQNTCRKCKITAHTNDNSNSDTIFNTVGSKKYFRKNLDRCHHCHSKFHRTDNCFKRK